MTTSAPLAPTGTSRRSLLQRGGIAALALGGGALAACSQQPSGSPPDPGPGAEDGSSAPGSGSPSATESPGGADSPDGAGSPDGAESPGGATGVGVETAAVPVGGGVVLEDADYVVTQPSAGQFRAFSKICTHQGCAVSEVAEGEITCFCHGSVFSGADGSVLQGPAEQPLPETPVTVEGDRLTIG